MRVRLLFALLVSCGGADGDDDPGPGDDCGGGEACADGAYCSVAGVCVADGGCVVDEDCEAIGAAGLTKCSVTQTCITPDSCAANGDCAGGMQCNMDSATCEIGGCGGEILDLTYVPPNFMIVLDRSCSMNNNLSGTQTTKWEVAVDALRNVLATYTTDIRWGMTLFPDTTNQSCAQEPNVPFPLADNNASGIDTMLNNALANNDPLFPDGPCVTNIDTAIQQAALDPGLADPDRANFVMLVSDGAQSGCNLGGGDAGTETKIGEMFAAGVTTFVVGFGSGTDASALDAFAVAGGAPISQTSPKYYQADTANQLDTVFQNIAGLVVSCEYTVDPAPADLSQTFVFFENTETVPHDTSQTEGWDFDPATGKLTLYGSYCTRVKDRTVTDVDVIYGCPTTPLE